MFDFEIYLFAIYCYCIYAKTLVLVGKFSVKNQIDVKMYDRPIENILCLLRI